MFQIHIQIQANVTGLVSKVDFINTDTGAVIRSEGSAPYCMFGNTGPNPFNLGRLGVGTHHVKAKAYSGAIAVESSILTINETPTGGEVYPGDNWETRTPESQGIIRQR